jgi:hypothetical protein
MLLGAMFKYWFLFVFVSYLVTVLMGNYIQTRGIREYGWRGFRSRPFLATYWHELSPWQRAALGPGICAFALTWVGGMFAVIVRHLRQ